MILRVGLTGGIGSGKTTVAAIFQVLGIPVYYADAQAKRMMVEDVDLVRQITAAFSADAYMNGQLNRAYLAAEVFGNKEKLQRLNAIVHPATISHAEQWMQAQTSRYAIKEAALIFESGVDKYLDYVIGVVAPLPLRLQRVTHRDAISMAEVTQRMQNQMPEEDKMKLCNAVITNDEQQAVLPQVLALHEKLLQLAAAHHAPMELVPIHESVEENEAFTSNPLCSASVHMTIDFYKRVGFVPPWIGYNVLLNGELVGSAGFKGKPVNGTVEIAYGTVEPYRKQGIGTAICRQLVALSLHTDPSIKITARTFAKENFSARILTKNHFICTGTVNDPEDGEVWEWVYAGSH